MERPGLDPHATSFPISARPTPSSPTTGMARGTGETPSPTSEPQPCVSLALMAAPTSAFTIDAAGRTANAELEVRGTYTCGPGVALIDINPSVTQEMGRGSARASGDALEIFPSICDDAKQSWSIALPRELGQPTAPFPDAVDLTGGDCVTLLDLPALRVSLSPTATFDHSGALTLTGEYVCPPGSQVRSTDTSLSFIQQVGRGFASWFNSERSTITCDGAAHAWTLTAQPSAGSKARGGEVRVHLAITAWGDAFVSLGKPLRCPGRWHALILTGPSGGGCGPRVWGRRPVGRRAPPGCGPRRV